MSDTNRVVPVRIRIGDKTIGPARDPINPKPPGGSGVPRPRSEGSARQGEPSRSREAGC